MPQVLTLDVMADGYGPPSVLPVTGLNNPQGLALDAGGDVYVVDYAGGGHTAPGHVVKLAAGSNAQPVLPFTGLNSPQGVAVDTVGNVYVIPGEGLRLAVLLVAEPLLCSAPGCDSAGERPIYRAGAEGTSALTSSPCNSLTVNDTSK
jgi:DNA-binding beta-propeller fold protein YncE